MPRYKSIVRFAVYVHAEDEEHAWHAVDEEVSAMLPPGDWWYEGQSDRLEIMQDNQR